MRPTTDTQFLRLGIYVHPRSLIQIRLSVSLITALHNNILEAVIGLHLCNHTVTYTVSVLCMEIFIRLSKILRTCRYMKHGTLCIGKRISKHLQGQMSYVISISGVVQW